MGCGHSREAVIAEINSIMESLKQENQELENIRNNLKLQQELTSSAGFSPPNLSELKTNSEKLETYLKTAKECGVTFLPPNTPDIHQNTIIINTISIQNELEDKNEKIYQLKNEIFTLHSEGEEIKRQISECESQIKAFSLNPDGTGDYDSDMKFYLKKMNQLEDCKIDLITQVSNLEQDCKDISDQIVAIESQENSDKGTGMSFEHLLTMSEEEVRIEGQKLDAEIKELTENLKKLKEKELEIEEMSNYVMGLKQNTSLKNQHLRQEVRETANRVKQLEKEKEKLKLEIETFRKGSRRLDRRSPYPEEVFEKKYSLDPEEYAPKYNLNLDIEETLRKARDLASSIRPKGTM